MGKAIRIARQSGRRSLLFVVVRRRPSRARIGTREGEPISSEPLRRIGPGHPPGRDPERTLDLPDCRSLQREPMLAVVLYNAAFQASITNRQLRRTVGAFGDPHDLVAELIMTSLPSEQRLSAAGSR